MDNDNKIAFFLSLKTLNEMIEDGFILNEETDQAPPDSIRMEMSGYYDDAVLSSEGVVNIENISEYADLSDIAYDHCNYTEVENYGGHEVASAELKWSCSNKTYSADVDTNDGVTLEQQDVDKNGTLCSNEDRHSVYSSLENKWYKGPINAWRLSQTRQWLLGEDPAHYKEALHNIESAKLSEFIEVEKPMGYNIMKLFQENPEIEWLRDFS